MGGLLGGTDTGNSGLGGLFGDTGGLDLGGLLGGTDSEDSGLGGLFSGLFGSISTRDSGLGGFDITSIDDLEAICDILTLLEILGTDTSTLRLLCDVLTILKDMDLDDCLNLEAMNLSTGTNDLLNNITTCLVESDNVSSVIGTIGGVATDKKGNVYVAEGLGWIYKFTSDGKHITKIGEHGSGPGMLISPSHIDVDTDGKVYVTDSMNSRVQIFRPGPPSGRRQRAIIVAGKKSQSEEGDELWKYGITQAHANSVYNALTYQGYTYETICYLTPDTDLDLDENAETDDVDEEPTLENLENALTNWASDADDVVLYLVGHGEKEGLFHINPDEKLEASSLKLWLDELRQKLPSEGKITVVYEACYAGSFLSPLALENDTGKERSGDITRILITSGSDEVVEYSGNESFSFSYHFWTHVFKGQDIKDAFEQASDVVDETPLLDGNSNGKGNEDEDYISVQNTFIGSGLRIDLRDRHPLRRRVILMAGDLQKDEQEDNLWPVIESNMKSTYDALRFQEYSDDNIYLMSPYSISDVSANIRKPSLDNLEDAITRWAKEHTYDLVLYLTGIGEKNGCFRINEMESLSAETLDEWLDTLQEELPSPVIVICDADYSGSFLPVLLPPENKRRLLIASAPPDQPAYFDSQENISFSSFFWRNISYGMNLKESFVTTLGSLNALDAAPQLEADGNGIANEKDVDAESARRYTIGTGIKVTRETPSDRYEDDDELGQAAAIDVGGTYPQIRNFYHAGDTDWIKFHALPENSYRIEATDLGEKCDVVMELYNSDDTDNYLFQQDNQLYSTADETRDWECDKEGFYYVKLYHADPQASGQDTTYYFSISKVPTGGGEGNIEGRVTDVCSGKLIQGAVVKTSANSASGISDDEGYYVIADHSAAETFKLLASAEEYENYESEAAIPLAEDETLMNQNIAMFPVISRIIKGDINYDNRINLTDAILALQISGETESSQSLCMFADVNEDNRIGLEEVIYILNILTDE